MKAIVCRVGTHIYITARYSHSPASILLLSQILLRDKISIYASCFLYVEILNKEGLSLHSLAVTQYKRNYICNILLITLISTIM